MNANNYRQELINYAKFMLMKIEMEPVLSIITNEQKSIILMAIKAQYPIEFHSPNNHFFEEAICVDALKNESKSLLSELLNALKFSENDLFCNYMYNYGQSWLEVNFDANDRNTYYRALLEYLEANPSIAIVIDNEPLFLPA
jgi:hypothetical protein